MSISAKQAAARAALSYVKDGMVLGLGSGTTAEIFLTLLAESNLSVEGVPTSLRTETLAREQNIPLLETAPAQIDLAIDGADEIDPHLNLIKGKGGALLREKITATAATRFVVIADESKRVERLGACPLPVEVFPFGRDIAAEALAGFCGAPPVLREGRSDNGNVIYDCPFGGIANSAELAQSLDRLSFVAAHGLFIGLASASLVGKSDGSVETMWKGQADG